MSIIAKKIDDGEISLSRWTPETPNLDLRCQKPKSRSIAINGLSRTHQQLIRDHDYLSKTRLAYKQVIKLPIISPTFNFRKKYLSSPNEVDCNKESRTQTKKLRDYETGIIYKFSSLGNTTFTHFSKAEVPVLKNNLSLYKRHVFKL